MRFVRSLIAAAWAVLLLTASLPMPAAPARAQRGAPAVTASAARGLWLLPRKDAQNSARADVPGHMTTAPREVWRYGGDRSTFVSVAPVSVGGKEAYLEKVRSGLRLIRPDGTIVWDDPKRGAGEVAEIGDFDGDGAPEAVVTLGTTGVSLIDVGTGRTYWTWITPTGSQVGSYQLWRHGREVRFLCFPQNATYGACLDLTKKGGNAPVVWARPYPNAFHQGFGPHIVLADMDNDGVDDIVLEGKPGYTAVIDSLTGAVRCESRADVANGAGMGRPYGLLQAVDLDGDGYRDVVMFSCQVEEYALVVRNEGGKGLKAVWSQAIEHDLPDDFRELRPNVTSVADVDGDGRPEIVTGLFNYTGDGRWHTLVLDPMKGLAAPKADLPDRYFWGCYDLGGDGRQRIVTSTEKARRTAETSTLQAVDGKSGRDVAILAKAALATVGGGPLPADRGFMARRATPIFLETKQSGSGLLLEKRDGKPVQAFWSVDGGGSRVRGVRISPVSYGVLASTGDGRQDRLDRSIRVPGGAGAATAATGPLVGLAGGRRELVFALSNGTVMGGVPDLTKSGAFTSSWTAPGSNPALWIGSGGERVLCTVLDNRVLLSEPRSGKTAPRVAIPLPYPFYQSTVTRSAPTLLPFGAGGALPRVFVGMQIGVHTMASALFDASAGGQLWADPAEGPYPRAAAAAPLDGTGRYTLIVDNHGKQFLYGEDGTKKLIAHGWHLTVPGRSDGAKYAVPIVGPFGPGGETRIVLGPGLQSLEVLDTRGDRVAKSDFGSTYEFEWCGSTVAKVGEGGAWEVGMANKDGIFHSFDAATCTLRWTLDMGCRQALPFNIAGADVDGDGRDEYLIGLPDGRLLALGEKDGKGRILWTCTFATGVRDVIAADVDGDGALEIVVETEEGCIHVLK